MRWAGESMTTLGFDRTLVPFLSGMHFAQGYKGNFGLQNTASTDNTIMWQARVGISQDIHRLHSVPTTSRSVA